jgi:hypothetical protein
VEVNHAAAEPVFVKQFELLDAVCSVVEYTILSAACQISAKSWMQGGWSMIARGR